MRCDFKWVVLSGGGCRLRELLNNLFNLYSPHRGKGVAG